MPIVGPTGYQHPHPNYQLNDLHQAMDYNAAGEPIIRTSDGITNVINIASGQMEGTSAVFKHGFNSSFQNGVEESFWGGSTLYPWTAWDTPGVLSLVSSAGDTGTVTIDGLDNNFEIITETKALNGTNAVVTDSSFVRINNMYYNTSATANSGNITASRNSTVIGYIPAGFGTAQMAQYTVPAGYTAYVMQGVANIGKGNDGTGYFKYRLFGGGFQYAFVFLMYQSTFEYKFTIPLALPERTDIDVAMIASNSGTAASCAYDLILIQNQS